MTDAPLLWRVIWITGASTGIGRELALLLARRGARVAVSARSADKLADLSTLSPNIVSYPVDVADRAAVARTVEAIESALGPIDLAILNAAIWRQMGVSDFDPAFVEEAMAVNFVGTTNALAPLMRSMTARRSGWIAMTASVAGYSGLPRSAAYAPTKAALINLAEGLREDLARKGVGVSIINPGFVETPMTAVNDFPMPFLMPASEAARRIVTGLEARRFEIAFPWQMTMLLKALRLLPYPLYFWVTRRMTGGGSGV